ncbi:hypothetical protein PG985_014261 [Apiospora marii]|uniref:uncharacterized protein n=1 Tax=Apiospora marii TaxID=335849 RepID=UPI003130BB7C
MSIQEPFEDIPHKLTKNFSGDITPNRRPVLIRNRDNEAMDCMWRLSQNMYKYPPGAYARGSWGYTILRTVYTPESDDLFPSAIAKLEKWLRQYYLHIGRFPMWGEQGEADHQKMADGSINDELGRRFRVELVQDAQKLNLPHLDRASQEDICSLCDVFDAWVASVGQDPHAECSISPRFCDCLAVDEEALRSLAAHPDEPPWLHVCATSEEKRVSTAATTYHLSGGMPVLNASIPLTQLISRSKCAVAAMTSSGCSTHGALEASPRTPAGLEPIKVC